jgi:hypothetical protein
MLLPLHTAVTSVYKPYIFNLSRTPRPGSFLKQPGSLLILTWWTGLLDMQEAFQGCS